MPPSFYQWIDLLWVPVAILAVHRGHRLMAALFVLMCVFTLRMQMEIMDDIGFPNGILGLIHASAYTRGLIVYGLIIALFLLLARMSKHTYFAVFIAAAITVYFFALAASSIVMLA